MALQAEASQEEEVKAVADSYFGENFTNTSALMIAFERDLESQRADALFVDPLAKLLVGGLVSVADQTSSSVEVGNNSDVPAAATENTKWVSKGESLSNNFSNYCTMFEFPDWPEFHTQWTACRTRFIDDEITKHAPSMRQLVNLGAGFDTRAYRLEAYSNFDVSYEVDMEANQQVKEPVFENLRNADSGIKPYCGTIENISHDFLSETTLEQVLERHNFDKKQPALFLAEGLIMYLGDEGEAKLLNEISTAAAPGSVLILNFMEKPGTSQGKIRELMDQWTDLRFSRFGDATLNFDRYPLDRFPNPSPAFSFLVCQKT